MQSPQEQQGAIDLVTISHLRVLLLKPESETLDFKRDQYLIGKGVSDEEKAKLIKDILAFANTIRESNAYILIGVKKSAPDQPVELFHVVDHPDDAQLQQLLHGKTNRPVRFHYEAEIVDGKSIGILTISPEQDRPLYLTKPYGGLAANIIKVRHGSSTADASPDEIAMMGEMRANKPCPPSIALEFTDYQRQKIGRNPTVDSVQLIDKPPPELAPDDMEAARSFFTNQKSLLVSPVCDFRSLVSPFAPTKPSDSEWKKYLREYLQGQKIGFWMKNHSDISASNVRVVVSGLDSEGTICTDELPERPCSSMERVQRNIARIHRQIRFSCHGEAWDAVIDIPQLRPKEEVWIDPELWVAASRNAVLEMRAQVFAHELPNPIEVSLAIMFNSRSIFYEPAMLDRFRS